jgi:hypothetical protein
MRSVINYECSVEYSLSFLIYIPYDQSTTSLNFKMADPNSIVSFRISLSPVAFVLHVDEDGFAVVDERLLCLRFHLQETSLLVEKEEFDLNGDLIRTVYQKPTMTESGTYYRVTAGSYHIIGGVASFNMSQASTLTPCTVASFDRRLNGRMKPTLPSVKESPEYTLLSSSDKEEEYSDAIFSIKSKDVSLDKSGDFSEEEDIDLTPHDEGIQAQRACSVGTTSLSNQMGSFVVPDTPSRSLGSESLDGSVAPSTEASPTEDFTASIG